MALAPDPGTVGGQIAAFTSSTGRLPALPGSGRLRLLAVTGSARSRFAPDVATYAESRASRSHHARVVWPVHGATHPRQQWPSVPSPPCAALVQKDMIDFGAPLRGRHRFTEPGRFRARTPSRPMPSQGPYVRRIGFTAES
ncbi:MAG: hypothetical protein IPI20_09280 [Rhodoferax sp.]|nr:hypothetical protein [Rhodoferax sp.]